MTTTGKHERKVAVMTTVAATMFSTVIALAYFVTCLATMLSATVDWSLGTIAAMLLCAAGPTFWLAYRLHRDIRRHQKSKAPSSLFVRQLATFAKSLRVPALLLAAGIIANHTGLDHACLWAIAVPVAVWTPAVLRWMFYYRLNPTTLLRGTLLLTTEQVHAALAAIRRGSREFINWCGLIIPERLASGHFLFVGAISSGKTVGMRLLMQGVLPNIRPGSDRRALIYDAKQNCLSILSGLRLLVPVFILNPFDARSVAWNMAMDVTTVAIALQVAHGLIPDEEGGFNAFFVKAARDLLGAVFIALHLTRPYQWTLADAVLILSNTKRAKKLLSSLPQTAHICREHFNRDPRTLGNVQSTINANLSMIRPIAAIWSRATHKISLTEWVQSEGILVLANDERLRAPIDALNRVILQRLTELVLSQSESTRRRTWFILDELKEMGKVEALPRLLTKGRSKGVRAVLAFQTIEGLRAVYGEQLANEVSGICTNKALLRTDSPETAQWAARVIGENEVSEWTISQQHGANASSSESQHIVKKEAVLPSQIMQLPLANAEQFHGFIVTPGIGTFRHTVHFARQLRPLGNVPNFVPRPDSDQYLIDAAPPSADSPRSSLDDIGPITDDDADGPPFQDDEDDDFDFENSPNT